MPSEESVKQETNPASGKAIRDSPATVRRSRFWSESTDMTGLRGVLSCPVLVGEHGHDRTPRSLVIPTLGAGRVRCLRPPARSALSLGRGGPHRSVEDAAPPARLP